VALIVASSLLSEMESVREESNRGGTLPASNCAASEVISPSLAVDEAAIR